MKEMFLQEEKDNTSQAGKRVKILPRIIRLRDAPCYLGMNKNYFNQHTRPCLTEIPIGKKGIGFDRLELEQWVAYTKQASGRPPKRRLLWDASKEPPIPGCAFETGSGISKKQWMEEDFLKALERATCRKHRHT